jgi:phenylpyruvate tautomerase PptA (4-oxalocrotonate tautomerase family)
MPIIEIEFVGEENFSTMAQEMADAIGDVLKSPAGQTWVKLRSLAPQQYAENQNNSKDVNPVFVSVLLRKLPENLELERISRSLGEVIGQISHRRPENIHVVFLPEGAGRVAFGGKLVI